MNEAILGEIARLLLKERLARAEQERLARSGKKHLASRKAEQAKTSQPVCRRSGQAAY